VFRIAKSEESESVRRRNFPSGGDWVSRDRRANMAVNSATKTDALLRIRWAVMVPAIEYAYLVSLFDLEPSVRYVI